jgi:hypothetical protein
MKKLKKNEMKQLVGGLRPPINGVCYGLGENCTQVGGCCPFMSLICFGPPNRAICRLIDDVI